MQQFDREKTSADDYDDDADQISDHTTLSFADLNCCPSSTDGFDVDRSASLVHTTEP